MFKYDDLNNKKQANLYELLIENDRLHALQREIEKKSYNEQIRLASDLILNCPKDKIFDLIQKLLTLENQSEDSFYNKAIGALKVQELIYGMLNPTNPSPHLFFSLEEYPDLFNQYQHLSTSLVNEHAIEIASNLVNRTSEHDLRRLAPAMNGPFERTNFSSVFNEALILKRLLDELNSNEAFKTFTDEEFNPNLFKKFQNISEHRITDVPGIAAKLMECPNNCVYRVAHGLQELNSIFANVDSPLKENISNLKSHFYQSMEVDKFDSPKKEQSQLQPQHFFFKPAANENLRSENYEGAYGPSR